MLGAAVLRAEKMIRPRLGCLEPHRGIAARNHILLQTERWNVEAVDHVLRSHDQLNVFADWDMQLVQFALTFHVLQLPHPLLRHYVNFGGVLARSASVEEDHRAPDKNNQKNPHRNHRPTNLQYQGAMDGRSFASVTPPVLKAKDGDHCKDCQRRRHRQHYQKNVEQIHGQRVRRCASRPKWKIIEHRYETCSSPWS